MADENVKVSDSSILPVLEKLVVELKKKPELNEKNLVFRLVPMSIQIRDEHRSNYQHDVYLFGEEVEQKHKGILGTRKWKEFTNILFRLRVPNDAEHLQISFGERSLQETIHANLKDYALKNSYRLIYDDSLRTGSFVLRGHD
jgi:hypothetical protein